MAIVEDKEKAEEEKRDRKEEKKQTIDLSHLPDAIPDEKLGDPQ